MNPNNSPWLHQLKMTRPVDVLNGDTKTDVAIVGAGISGAITAYFTLKYTDKQVLLLEGSRVAHGATGHNAGQLVARFEREFHDIVREYGLELAADAERSIHSAWVLLDQVFEEANLTTPMSTFVGYSGFSGIDILIDELKNNALRKEAGINIYPIYIADHVADLDKIPAEYRSLYELIPHKDILSLLETQDSQYIAVTAEKKGALNSALFVEELVGFMLDRYKGRFRLAEKTSVEKVILDTDSVLIKTKTNIKNGEEEKNFSVKADKIVLCTNGFERLAIDNKLNGDIDTEFHHMIHGTVGYMSAYLEEMNRPPMSLSYYDQNFLSSRNNLDFANEGPYFYVTRRPYEIENSKQKNQKHEPQHNLICIGGPEVQIGDTRKYVRESEFDKEMGRKISKFVEKTYKKIPGEHFKYSFEWHGLMGYTPGGIRVIGAEPLNKNLLYNLGCNGIGIMPAIFGGMKIGKLLSSQDFPPSIFDPKVLHK
jgi:glycine/D-amino acid oxidase-like deaminating enzyme